LISQALRSLFRVSLVVADCAQALKVAVFIRELWILFVGLNVMDDGSLGNPPILFALNAPVLISP